MRASFTLLKNTQSESGRAFENIKWRTKLVKGVSQPRETSQRIEFCILTKEKKAQSRALGIVAYYQEHIPYTFGEALRMCMEKVKITVADLSALTGISDRQIGRMRNDETKDISFRTIVALCVALNLVAESAEKLLNIKRYTLNCDDPYVQVCKMFLETRVTVVDCNDILKSCGYEPLTDGEIWAV